MESKTFKPNNARCKIRTPIRVGCTPFSPIPSKHSHQLEAGSINPSSQDKSRSYQTKHACKHLGAQPTTVRLQDGARDGVRRQAAQRCSKKDEAGSKANLSNGRDLHDQGRGEGDVCAREEAKEGGECDARGCGGRGDPKGENPEAGHVADDDEDVVAADFVADKA